MFKWLTSLDILGYFVSHNISCNLCNNQLPHVCWCLSKICPHLNLAINTRGLKTITVLQCLVWVYTWICANKWSPSLICLIIKLDSYIARVLEWLLSKHGSFNFVFIYLPLRIYWYLNLAKWNCLLLDMDATQCLWLLICESLPLHKYTIH